MSDLVDGIVAGGVAAVLSGLPSTIHAVATGGDPLEASLATGWMVAPEDATETGLLAAAVPVHLALSFGWGVVLAYTLPRRATVLWGVVAGLGIAALDLGIGGRRFERIRALPAGPQIADHAAFGAVVGMVLAARRKL